MLTPKTPQEAAPQPTTEYCEVHDATYDPALDEWLDGTCSDPNCEYCVGRPEKPSLVVRKQQSET